MLIINQSSKPVVLVIMLISLTDSTLSSILELYMHDIIAGRNPTARPVTGLLGAIYSGQVPFVKPISNEAISAGASPFSRGLGFGTVTVIDDVLTMGPEVGSQALGRARGVYVATSGSSVMMAFTAVMEGGEYGDSVNLYGVFLGGTHTTSRLAVVGGTGKFRNARGVADIRALIPPAGQRYETLLRIRIHLKD